MATIWKEPLDPDRHRDHFHDGYAVSRARVHGDEVTYFVRVAGFTFELASIAQLRARIVLVGRPHTPDVEVAALVRY